jgi:hypothetical protein
LHLPRRRSYLATMDGTRTAARRRALIAAAVLLVAAAGLPARAAVTLQATSTQVSSPGGTGRVCVILSTGGEQVAGIQADVRWDGTCTSLTSKDRCVPAGSHNKDVHADIEKQQADFMAKVLVLSLSNVDVIPDGPVFCCEFQGEAEPGSCCSVSLSGTSASTPDGHPIAANPGRPAQICTAGSGNQPGRGFGSPSGQGPLSASNAPAPGEEGGAAPPAQAPAAQPGGGRAPAAQVLQGGGAQVQNPPEAVVASTPAPALQRPTPAAAAAPTAPAAVLTPQALQPPLPPPTGAATTAAATSAPTEATAAPAAVDTPAIGSTAALTKATVAPTKPAAVAKPPAEPPAAQAAEDRGWFGCQIETGASAGPLIGLGLLALLGTILQRRRR